MSKAGTPRVDDDDVVAVLLDRFENPTYVIKNILARTHSKYRNIKTSHVLSALRRLEQSGRVETKGHRSSNSLIWRLKK